MRLRLAISRNGLPPMKIWWDTSSFQPGDDKTVSSLLARVSQIVPLESSKWGLEDYAVEIDGFEVLHFQEVESIIREADEVVIRPLSGTEIKQRRLSGRRQISTSGRKLIDGTPFGRSFLRPAPDRPNLAIPPRKRRKLGQIGADDSITVQVGSETDDDSYNEDEDEGEEEGMEEMEVEDRSEDTGSEESEVAEQRLIGTRGITTRDYTPILGDQEDQGKGVEYENPLMDYFYDEINGRESESEDIAHEVTMRSDSSTQEFQESEESDSNSETQEESTRFRAGYNPESILGVEIDSYESSEDGDFDPSSFDAEDEDDDDEEERQEEMVGEQSTTIRGVNVDSSDGLEDEDFNPRKFVPEVECSDEESEAESSSSSSSGSGSGSERQGWEEEVIFHPKKFEQAMKLKNKVINHQRSSSSLLSSSSSSLSSESPGPQQPTPPRILKGPPVTPGTVPHQGKKSTKARNKRKNENRKLKRLIELGVLPEGTNHAGYLQYLEGKGISEPSRKHSEPLKQVAPQKQSEPGKQHGPENSLEGSEKRKNDETVKPVNKRKRYRKAFAKAKKNGSVPEDQDLDKWIEEREQKRNAEHENDNERNITLKDADRNAEQISIVVDEAPTEESSKQRNIPGRPSVNLDVLRRTIIHDLALSKKPTVAVAEEEIMRKEWAQIHHRDTTNKRKGFAREQYGKRPKKIIYDDYGNPVSVGAEDALGTLVEPEDPNAWRKKLVLTAVECEWEGVELPPPSFPFKQPPFKNLTEIAGNKRKRKGGKGKKQQQGEYWRNRNDGYGQDDSYYQQQQQDDWTHDYYDDTTQPNNNQATDTIMEKAELIDDLPPLPEDISSLFSLSKPVLPQTVIAFKQLTMDANYTPILAGYRTAVIEEVDDQVQDGPFLVLKLAIRDRLKRDIDKETGEKVLRKFEMPGNEDDDEGRIELMFGELLEPKVVKLPEIVEVNGVQELVDGRGDGGGDGGKKNDGNGDENAMDDTTGDGVGRITNDTQKGRQDKTSNGEYHSTQASEQGNNATELAIAAGGEDIIRGAVGGEEVILLNPSLPKDKAIIKTPQENSNNIEVDTPVAAQAARTNSPVYSQDYSQFKTPEPEAQRDVPMIDGDDYQPSTNDNHKDDSRSQPGYGSDSDGLPTLESILASQSQRISIKRESIQADDEPQLPLLPQFSPFGTRVSDDAARSLDAEKSLDEQQIQQEVEGAKRSKPGRGRPKKPIGSSQAQVIDLTIISSDPPVERLKRGRPHGKKPKGDLWRAVRD